MKATDLLRIRELFLAASDLRPNQRLAYLDSQADATGTIRAQVEELLQRLDADPDDLQSPFRIDADDPEPDAIGPYRVIRRIGEGGMGVVYLAEQSKPVQRQVAVKRIKAGMDSKAMLRRFEAERDALARMDHPAIARVLDAGVDRDGRPYFAMEYVDGVSLIDYCDRAQLDPEARLRLFVDVCLGVQHAHQKGVLHRDLKPSNVLVAEVDGKPMPKIIDFGVAKALERRMTEQTVHTQLGVMIGTPEYMSPEQAEPGTGDIDTRSDVYSLGVILYELLSGELPFSPTYLREQGFAGIQRVLQHEDPPRPSTRVSTVSEQTSEQARRRRLAPHSLAQRLRGDLDWITMCALHKRREQRYGSAGEFAADIARHLRCEPVLAGPPTVSYRLQKFLRRYRSQAVTAALVATALLLGTGVSVWFAFDARALAHKLEGAQRDVLKEKRAVEGVLDRAVQRIERKSGGNSDPAAEASMRATIGEAYSALGRHEDASAELHRAVVLLEAVPEATAEQIYPVLRPYLIVGLAGGTFTQQEGFHARFLRATREILFAGEPELQRAIEALEELGPRDPGNAVFERLLNVAARRFARDDARWITLADLLTHHLPAYAGRTETGQRLLAIYADQRCALTDPGWLHARLQLMRHCRYTTVGRYELQLAFADDALTALTEALPRRHWFEGLVRFERGYALAHLDRLGDAERELRATRAILDDALGPDNLMSGWTLQTLVECLDRQGRGAEAEGLRFELAAYCSRMRYPAGIECAEIVLRPEFTSLSNALIELDQLRFDPAAALPRLDEIVAQSRTCFPEPGVRAAVVAKFLMRVGHDLSNAGAHSAAMRRLFEYIDEVLRASASARSWDIWYLASHCQLLGDFAAGERVAARALTRPMAVTDPGEVANLQHVLGLCRFALGGGDEALELALTGYRDLADTLGIANGNTGNASTQLLGALRRAGQTTQAREFSLQRLQRLEHDGGDAASLWWHASASMWQLGDDAQAARAVALINAHFAGDFRASCASALLAGIRFDRDAAITHARQALASAPDNSMCQDRMAKLYSHLGMQAEADDCAQRAIELSNTAEMRNNRARWLSRLGALDRALELSAQLARDYPRYAPASANVARCLLARDDLDGALAAAQRAFDLEPQVGRGILARVRLARGEQATELFVEQANVIGRPNGSGFWPDYAAALARVGRFDEARRRLDRLTTEWSTEPHAWSARALALSTMSGATNSDHRTALACAEQAVERSSRQGPVMLAALAEAQFQLGNAEAAVLSLDECLRVMAGRNAEWLPLEDVAKRRRRYAGN